MMEYKNIEHALKHMHAQLWHIVEMNIDDTTSIVALHVIYYENDNFHFCYTNTLHTKIEIARMEKLQMLVDCYSITMQDWLLISPTYPPHSQTPYYQLPLLPERTDE